MKRRQIAFVVSFAALIIATVIFSLVYIAVNLPFSKLPDLSNYGFLSHNYTTVSNSCENMHDLNLTVICVELLSPSSNSIALPPKIVFSYYLFGNKNSADAYIISATKYIDTSAVNNSGSGHAFLYSIQSFVNGDNSTTTYSQDGSSVFEVSVLHNLSQSQSNVDNIAFNLTDALWQTQPTFQPFSR